MVVRQFDHQVQELLRRLVLIGRIAQDLLANACDGFDPRGRHSNTNDRQAEVEMLQQGIESMALKLATLQQPVGADARLVVLAPKIAQEYARIANHAACVSRERCNSCDGGLREYTTYLHIMSDVVQKMVAASIDLIISKKVDILDELLILEAEVNSLRDRINREVTTNLSEHAESIDCSLKILNASRELERAGDEALRIALETHYVVKGTSKNVQHRTSEQN